MISHYPRALFPEMEVVERAALPPHPRRRPRDLGRCRRPARGGRDGASQAPVRRGRAAGGLELDLARDARRGSTERLAIGADQVYAVRGLLDLADVAQLYALDRPDLKYEPWLPYTQRRLARLDGRRSLRRDRAPRHRRPSSVRLVRDERRGLPAGRCKDPQVVALKTTVYRTSDDSALAPALDQGLGERQADRLRRRAESALRRAAQHRLGALARTGRRPRRLRLPRHEDPREDDARRPARRRTSSAATSTSAPATTTRRQRGSTRTSGLHRRS